MTDTLCDLSTHEISQDFMATSLKIVSELDDVLLDSATTSHMFWKHLAFTNYMPPTKDKAVLVGNGYPL
jgi:hypothetical protein